MPIQVVELLRELIAVPSVNPRLALPGDPHAGEHRLTEWLARFAADRGWRWATQAAHPERENFVALVRGGAPTTLMFEVHQDTVSGEGMQVDPFRAELRDDRVYGRGACDVKGGMAAMLAALIQLEAEPAERRPNVLLACTVNEECGFTGARALASVWRSEEAEIPPLIASQVTTALRSGDFGSPVLGCSHPFEGGGSTTLTLEELRALRPSACVVAEPTALDVVVAHRGAVRWQCIVRGRAAHSSRPERGANAIYAMTSVVRLIEEFNRDHLAARDADPLCGASVACVTTFHAGTGPNTIPDRAVIDIDRRLLPTESPQAAFAELVEFVAARAELQGCRLEHAAPWMESRGLPSGGSRQWAEELATIVRATGAPGKLVGVPYGTDAAAIAAVGIPTVVFGPGSIDQAHTADEWIAVDQLERAVDAYVSIARGVATR